MILRSKPGVIRLTDEPLDQIGIEKGKPFAPDERMKKILTDAANIGAVTARTLGYKIRDKNGFIYPDSYWRKPFFRRRALIST
jgi:hypothetical protein